MQKITFIIPVYNNIDHTKRAVHSIISNSPPGRFNFLFVDNGSTDGTSKFLATVPNAHVLYNEKNIFVNPAWNQAFKYVLDHDLGDYCCLCNNDIVAGSNWIDSVLYLLDQNRNEWYLPTSNTQENPPFGPEHEFSSYCDQMKTTPLKLTLVYWNFIGFCMFFHKRHIKNFYPIPEELKVLRGDDWITDFMASRGVICFRVNHCAAHHFGGATQRGMSLHNVICHDADYFEHLVRQEYPKRQAKRIPNVDFPIKLL